jgi:hypothetical protein
MSDFCKRRDCPYYYCKEESMYLSNGDPGYPFEEDCLRNWDCPYTEEDEDEY